MRSVAHSLQSFESVITACLQPKREDHLFSIFDPTEQLDDDRFDARGIAQALNAAFLITLAGSGHPAFSKAKGLLTRSAESSEWANVTRFYLNAIELIHAEIEAASTQDPDFRKRLEALSECVSQEEDLNADQLAEKLWSLFFPEGAGIRANRSQRVEALREKRTVHITQLNSNPIADPVRQILFTSNVLLTLPPRPKPELPLSDELKEWVLSVAHEPQLYWYDHPIPLDIEPENNEVLYGLRGLDSALEFEQVRGNCSHPQKLACVLSVSVTHRGLQEIALRYLEEQFSGFGGLKHIDLYVFTEANAEQLIDEILVPAAERYLQRSDAKEMLRVFGVNGEYGRHYSFLKAISAFWKIFIQPEKEAVFKIDLDQVFPQKELVEETHASAFEHFRTPLWGARGLDSDGKPVELAMIAGALVNERDIGESLFTPDVRFPRHALSPDEHVFFSTLPQALSTEAEMTARYRTEKLDGTQTCLQRIHVTGGTNGILIDSLRRHRPFTPSFISRAEDQAYILSAFRNPGPRLAYVHKDGLIMRHDKEAFGQEAIRSAYVGKLVGDYVRILYFSAYARSIRDDVGTLKDLLDPFTGCFISRIPTTVSTLRFAFKAASLVAAGNDKEGFTLITLGAQRLTEALEFLRGTRSRLEQQLEKERLGWSIYYDALSAVEDALKREDHFAVELRKKADSLIGRCAIRAKNGQENPPK